MSAAIVSAFAIVAAALIGSHASLLHRIGRLEARVSLLTALNREWWVWAQKVIALYQRWCHPDSPELPPIPTEQTANEP